MVGVALNSGERGAALLTSRLRERRLWLAVAESCTGGDLAAALTSVPGASACFWGGVVVYTPEAKAELLGVSPGLIQEAGVVSLQVTEALARNLRRRAEVDLTAAVTGWAGPTTEGRDPVGTVYCGIASRDGVWSAREWFPGDRSQVRAAAVNWLLNLLIARVDLRVGFGGN